MSYSVRPSKVGIGTNASSVYSWLGVKSAEWEDIDPWRYIDIPAGQMVKQHLLSPLVKITLEVENIEALFISLYETQIDAIGHYAIDPDSSEKWTIGYFVISVVQHDGSVQDYMFENTKVAKFKFGKIQLGIESKIIVEFTADRMIPL